MTENGIDLLQKRGMFSVGKEENIIPSLPSVITPVTSPNKSTEALVSNTQNLAKNSTEYPSDLQWIISWYMKSSPALRTSLIVSTYTYIY